MRFTHDGGCAPLCRLCSPRDLHNAVLWHFLFLLQMVALVRSRAAIVHQQVLSYAFLAILKHPSTVIPAQAGIQMFPT